ncbi:MAG: zf-HC2 domain-containing protein, partial [Krumholzibacteria bacterium]|nr:zf-HC2 domain-containing protein [Candidatus Krumholzibacteria bacterium]
MPRNDHTSGTHPDPELLAARATGLLATEAAARVDAHVAGCPVCRLEMARAARFPELDRDDETAAAAGWEAARPRLDAAWHSAIWPA